MSLLTPETSDAQHVALAELTPAELEIVKAEADQLGEHVTETETVDVEEFYRYTMTLNDLKKIIAHVESEGMPGDALVVLSKDGEGNWFSPLAGYGSDYVFVPRQENGGDFESLRLWDNCEDETLDTEEAWRAHTLASDPRARQCIVLWPV